MHFVECQTCGAELPPADANAFTTCRFCKTSITLPPAAPTTDSDTLAASPAYGAARIAMTDEAVLALLWQHLGEAESTFLAPSIPGGKELGARALHARHLPSDERVLALYDDSVFGTGDDGFLVTSARVCWKNAGDRARSLAWEDLDPHRMYADRQKLVLGAHAIEITGDESILEACEQAFFVLAFSARAEAGTARSGSGIALRSAADSSGALATSASGSTSASAPPTWRGGGTGTTPLPAHADTRPSTRPTLRPSYAPTLESAIPPARAVSGRAAIANAAPPPPHGVTLDSYVVHASSQRGPAFACWHCHTPLHMDTPQCSRCDALPSAQGWLRTA
jgi:hypothetical protein